jgi:hypothetical protein
MTDVRSPARVAYLFGAGASHASAKAVGSAYGTLMGDLNDELAEEVRRVVEQDFDGHASLLTLTNEMIGDESDIEHVITFLDESSSGLHRKFAAALRTVFERVLRNRLDAIDKEQAGKTPNQLYALLLDMYTIPAFPETLAGFLTLNYDTYLESAINQSPKRVCDTGISTGAPQATAAPIKTIKLHGSFDWNETWPVTSGHGDYTLWIPPGIQKAKTRYPFNMLWGLARELLTCDILRVIGCRLGANDWDLISLLFTTRHTNTRTPPYRIEIIDSPDNAVRIQKAFPYLGVKSILEVEPIGSQLVSEFTGRSPSPFADLSPDEQQTVIEQAGTARNWFQLWLKHKAEATFRDLGSVATESGEFEKFLEAN